MRPDGDLLPVGIIHEEKSESGNIGRLAGLRISFGVHFYARWHGPAVLEA